MRQQLYSAVEKLNDETCDDSAGRRLHAAPSTDDEDEFTLSARLFMDGWESTCQIPSSWKNKFVGPTVRLTRNELLYLLGNKLRITGSQRRVSIFEDEILLQMRKLKWEFFDVLTTSSRKFVVTLPRTSRRDFVRLEDDV